MSTGTFELGREEIQQLAEAGGAAPSGGNIQPWRVVAKKNVLELYLDEKRSTSFLDVERYASILALGAFAENVSIASDALKLKYKMKTLPYKGVEQPLAQFEYSGHKNKAKPSEFYPYVHERVTNRRLHEGPPVAEDTVDTLINAARALELCNLHALAAPKKKETAARILGRADGLRMFNQTLHQQMFEELRWSTEEAQKTGDGIDIATLEMPPEAAGQLGALRSYETLVKAVPREAVEAMAMPAVMGCSHICCLTVDGDINPKNLFLAGRSLQRMWLEATRQELAIQPWAVLPFFLIRSNLFPGTGFSEVEESQLKGLGKDLRSLFGFDSGEQPLFIFRLSKAPPPSARSLRLPWRQFTRVL